MNQNKVSVLSLLFWKAYWITLRPYLFFVSGIVGLVGLALWDNSQLFSLKWILVFFFSLVSYGLGQAITDCTQLDTDSISSPYRPLVKGTVSPLQVGLVSLVMLLIGGIFFYIFNPYTALLVGAMIFGLTTYTFFKRRFWGGPPWNSWIVALIPLLSYIAGNAFLRPWNISNTLWCLMGSTFFSYAIFVILGYFKDISADRKTGYQTVVVRFGWLKGVYISLICAFLAILCSFFAIQSNMSIPTSVDKVIAYLLWIIGAIYLFIAHYQLIIMKQDEDLAFTAIANSVRGYVLMHAGEVVFLNPQLMIFTIIFCLMFEVQIKLRPEKKQV